MADVNEQRHLYEEARRAFEAAMSAYRDDPLPGTPEWRRFKELLNKLKAALAAYSASLTPSRATPFDFNDMISD